VKKDQNQKANANDNDSANAERNTGPLRVQPWLAEPVWVSVATLEDFSSRSSLRSADKVSDVDSSIELEEPEMFFATYVR
jgi:hypothetical protein